MLDTGAPEVKIIVEHIPLELLVVHLKILRNIVMPFLVSATLDVCTGLYENKKEE